MAASYLQQAVCVRKTKTKKPLKAAAAKTHHDLRSSPATAATERRGATKHVQRVRP